MRPGACSMISDARLILAAPLIAGVALAAGAARAQGVPVTDAANLARSIARVEAWSRDFLRQSEKLATRTEQVDLHQQQREAFERFLEQTTGPTDVSGFEAGLGFPSAAETYPVTEDSAAARRLFGEGADVEQMIVTTAARYAGDAGVSATGLTPLTWRILFQSLIKQESRFNNAAVSPVGAMGFCQLMPGTAADLGVDPRDPWQNLDGGARYLLAQLDRFGRIDHALAAYNAGPGRVIEYGGIPPFAETQAYVRRIHGYYQDYLGRITGRDQLGTLAGLDGASAQWGNWSDAAMIYGVETSTRIDQAMARILGLLQQAEPISDKAAVDHNTYMLAERARLMALTLRLQAARVKVAAAAGLVEAADDLQHTTFWEYSDG